MTTAIRGASNQTPRTTPHAALWRHNPVSMSLKPSRTPSPPWLWPEQLWRHQILSTNGVVRNTSNTRSGSVIGMGSSGYVGRYNNAFTVGASKVLLWRKQQGSSCTTFVGTFNYCPSTEY